MQPVINDKPISESTRPSATEPPLPSEGEQIATLRQWQDNPMIPAVALEPHDDPTALFGHLDQLTLIAVNFPDLNDGRGFSIGRALREAGFTGELRASGNFIRDQLQYLKRCGFDAYDLSNEVSPEDVSASLNEFTVHYHQVLQSEREASL